MKSRNILLLLLLVATATVIALSWRNQARPQTAPPESRAPSHPRDTEELPIPTRRIPLRPPGPGSSSTATNQLTPWQQTLARLQSEAFHSLPREQIEAYLRRSSRDPANLLAAYRLSRDKIYLAEAAQTHPHDPRIQVAMLADSDLTPEQRQQWLARLKQSAPDNALANCLAAADLFKSKQTAAALQELAAAAQKNRFDDYATADLNTTEEMLLLSGKSPIESKAIAFSGTSLPHISTVNALSKEIAALQKDALAHGDPAAAQSYAALAVGLARQITAGPSGSLLIEQLVAMSIEKRVLEPLAQNQTFDLLRQTPAERLAILKAQREEIRFLTQAADAFDPNSGLTESEVLAYFERLKNSGELAALRWLNTYRTNAP